jgi:hypothetical protein
MRTLALTMIMCLIPTVVAQDDAEAEVQRILERASRALGGEKRAGYQGVTWKGKGKFRQADIALEFDGDASVQGLDRMRLDLTLGGMAPLTIIVNGDKGWVKTDQAMPLPEQLAPLRADLYALALSERPHELRKKPFRCAPLGEVQLQGKPALGVRVTRDGSPEVNVFYDKETSLPLKCEVRVKDPSTAQEVSDEFLLTEYQMFDGLPHYTKMVGTRDGREYLERELIEVRWHEKLSDDLFAAP